MPFNSASLDSNESGPYLAFPQATAEFTRASSSLFCMNNWKRQLHQFYKCWSQQAGTLSSESTTRRSSGSVAPHQPGPAQGVNVALRWWLWGQAPAFCNSDRVDYAVHHTDRGLKSSSARKIKFFRSFFLLWRSKNATLVKAKANTASSVGRTGSCHSHINTPLSLSRCCQIIPHLFTVQNSIAYARIQSSTITLHVRKLGLSCSLLLIWRYWHHICLRVHKQKSSDAWLDILRRERL